MDKSGNSVDRLKKYYGIITKNRLKIIIIFIRTERIINKRGNCSQERGRVVVDIRETDSYVKC